MRMLTRRSFRKVATRPSPRSREVPFPSDQASPCAVSLPRYFLVALWLGMIVLSTTSSSSSTKLGHRPSEMLRSQSLTPKLWGVQGPQTARDRTKNYLVARCVTARDMDTALRRIAPHRSRDDHSLDFVGLNRVTCDVLEQQPLAAPADRQDQARHLQGGRLPCRTTLPASAPSAVELHAVSCLIGRQPNEVDLVVEVGQKRWSPLIASRDDVTEQPRGKESRPTHQSV